MPKTETKHTPAPWHVAGHGNANKELPILREDGKEIGCIRGEARLADAALIAAAPELLAACRAMLKALKDRHANTCMSLEYWTSPAVQAMTAAIEKADA